MEQQIKDSLLRLYTNPKTVVTMQGWQRAFAQAVMDEEYYRNRLANPNPGDTKENNEAGLASTLIIQGRYSEAYEVADQTQRAYIKVLQAAEEEHDERGCADGPLTFTGKRWSEKRQEFLNFMECPKCGFINLTPETVL